MIKEDVWKRNRLIRDGIYRAIYERMKEDPSIYIMGEGSSMKIHYDSPQIEKEFSDKVITLPISEDGNTNFAVGMALGGVTPIVDVITADFLYRTMDSICNTARVTNFVQDPRTIIIRAEFLMAGPTTGSGPEALFTHIPGLNVVIPSNPLDAYILMHAALKKKEITLFFEDRMIEDSTTDSKYFLENNRVMLYQIEDVFGKAFPKRNSNAKLTIVSYGLTFRLLELLVKKEKLNCELIDLRFIYPIDFNLIFESVKRTHNLLIVEPDVQYAGVGAEIAAQVSEKCFGALRTPVRRLGAPRATIPVC